MAKRKGKSQRKVQPPQIEQAAPAVQPSRMWALLKTRWAQAAAAITALALVFSITADFAQTVDQLPASLKRVGEWWSVDSDYSGTWTNETEGMDVQGLPTDGHDYVPPPDQGAVSLSIEVRDGELSGEITSRSIADKLPYSRILVSGEKRWRRIELVAWDLIGGKGVPLATLEMKHTSVDDQERLVFRTREQSWPGMFPETFYVWRGDMPEATFNPKLFERAMSEKQRESPKK